MRETIVIQIHLNIETLQWINNYTTGLPGILSHGDFVTVISPQSEG